MKRFLLCVLALCLVIASLPVAMAEEKPTVTIRILLNGPEYDSDTAPDGEIFRAFAAKFADEVTLVPEWLPSEGAESQFTTLRIMAQNNDMPGVIGGAVSSIEPFVEAGLIQDLNTIVDEEWKSRLLDNVEEQYTMNGILAGVPQQVGMQGWFYNGELFEKCGLEIPKTFDDLLHCVEVFNENGIIPIAQSGSDPFAIWGWQYYFHRYGFLDMVEPILNHEMKFHNDQLVKGFEKMAQLHDAGAFPENMSVLEAARAVELFKGGEAAMFQSGTWEAPGLSDLDFADSIVFDWGPTFADGIEEQNLAVKQVGAGMFAGKSPDPDEAKWALEYIKFWAEEEAVKIQVEKTGWIPGVRAEIDTSMLPIVSQHCFEAAFDDSIPVTLEISMMFPSSFTTTYWAGVSGVLNGNLTPEEALDMYDEWNDTRTD